MNNPPPSQTRIYRCWSGMKRRVAERDHCGLYDPWWDFDEFKDWALENGYTDELVLCRNRDKGDYKPDNVRWDTVAANNLENKKSIATPKEWLITCPDGTEEEIEGLRQYCKDKGLSYASMLKNSYPYRRGYSHKGYFISKVN